MSLAPGLRLGPYEVIAPLGAGGMGRAEIRAGQPVRVVPGSGIDFVPSSDGQRFLILETQPIRPLALLNWKSRLTTP